MAESEEELKSLLMKVKEESEKAGLKVNIQKTEIMASGPITSWEIDGETVETVSDFILGGSKITADGDCNQEIKRHLLLGRKVVTNPDSILKSRDITLSTKVRLVTAKSLQLCPTLCNPIDGSPPDSSIHGIFQARVLEWGAKAMVFPVVMYVYESWTVKKVEC